MRPKQQELLNEIDESTEQQRSLIKPVAATLAGVALLGVVGNLDKDAADITEASNEKVYDLASEKGLIDLDESKMEVNVNPELLAVQVFEEALEQGRAEASINTAVIYADGVEFNPFVVSIKGGEAHKYLMRYDAVDKKFTPIDIQDARVVNKIQKGGDGNLDRITGKFNWVPASGDEPGHFVHEQKQISVGRLIPANGTEQGITILENAGYDVSAYRTDVELIEARKISNDNLDENTGQPNG